MSNFNFAYAGLLTGLFSPLVGPVGAFIGAIFGTALGGLFWKNVAGTSREVAELEQRVSELEGERGRDREE
ncbi:hypothetical protein CV102_11530 [Natronococcus pandeyae]|uniref:Uncharacterized protein n=1 Tax=Natronococcus pandeyae TaxID=2055836 RepID=A0A8J8Q376_9EURY|nr:hypothetical protein [Natronococcus pandeyae]TYL38432.1 hypothetical protein CV102_11530 [Natronococcus pandeyae]